MERELSIAVILPTYKPKEYIIDCLESIENQSINKDKFKVYIGLNGSSKDDEKFLLGNLANKTFDYKYIFIDEAGVSNARNILIKMSAEEYITFLDDDDVLSKNYLEALLEVTTTKIMGISNCKLFTGKPVVGKLNFLGKSYQKLNKEENNLVRIRKYFSSMTAKMLHRDMLDRYLLDPNLKIGEDAYFMTVISPKIRGTRKANNECCYYVRQRVGSASRSLKTKREKIEIAKKQLLRYFKLLLDKNYNKIFILTRIIAVIKNIWKG